MDTAATHATDDEPHLLRRARWGDEQAFALLYRRHAPAVHGLALRLTGNAATAEDLTQEAFLRMVRFIGGLQADRPLRPWLKRVVANAAVDLFRRQGRLEDAGDREWPEPGPGPEQHSEADAVLRRLPPLVRTVLWLHQVEGWTHAELGRRFGRSESWSKSLVARALERMREHTGEASQ